MPLRPLLPAYELLPPREPDESPLLPLESRVERLLLREESPMDSLRLPPASR
ncbi:MAG: hypothetical protein ACM3SO_04820 [Betaproteobacteria bacterium]